MLLSRSIPSVYRDIQDCRGTLGGRGRKFVDTGNPFAFCIDLSAYVSVC